MRRVALLLAAVMVLGTGVASAVPATAAAKDKKEKKIKSCKKDKKLEDHIQEAFVPFFLGETAREMASSVQDGDKIIPMLEESAAAAEAGGQSTSDTSTYPVSIVATCDGKKAATFTYDLALAVPKPVTAVPSSGAGLEFAGDAALVKGKWLITALTICDLIGANPATPTLGQECQDAVLG